MSKSLSLGRTSAKGGFNILWGLMISSIISAVGVMIVAGILSEEEFGLVTVALIGPNIIMFIKDLGLDQATIKHATQYKTEGNTKRLESILVTGTTFEIVFGTIFTLISILASGFMANILERPTIVPLIQIASFIILAGALLKAAQSAFIGYERIKLHSVTLIIHSVLKTGLMILLVTLSFGTYGAIIGNAVSYLSAGIISVILLYLVIIKQIKTPKSQLEIMSTLRTMLKFGLPLSVSAMLVGVLSQFYSFLVAIYSTDLIMGNYQIALNFVVLVNIFSSSLTTILFPTFSKIKAHEDPKTLKDVFQYSVKYATLLVVPLTFAVMVLSEPGVASLFYDKYEYAPLLLSLYVITYLYSAAGSLSASSLINSQGKTKVNMKITILTFMVGIVLSLVLIPYFGVYGLIATNSLASVPGLVVSLWWIKKNYNVTVNWVSSIKILVASAFSAGLTYFVINSLSLSNWICLVLGAAVFLGSYIFVAPLIGAITYGDTQNLKDMLKSLGPLALVIDVLLYPIEKITSATKKET
ncbi:MAG: oligosaccharide flippase family protein [Candidatus Bathyarchaeota archaeon]|nr:oligosaccharide flippase family protein [Candidatus Bathyarchaeum sp.]